MGKNVEFHKAATNAMVVKMGCYDIGKIESIFGMLNRSNEMNVHILRYNHDSRRMCPCCLFHSNASIHDILDKAFGRRFSFLIKEFLNITPHFRFTQRLYSTSNIHLIFPEKSFYVFAKLWAIFIRVIDINIGYLIPVIPKKSGERDIVTILDERRAADRAGLVRQVVAAAIGTILRIKPVLQIQGEKLDSFAKTRTLQGGKEIMINAIRKDMETRFGCTENFHNVHLEMAYTYNLEEAEKFKEELSAAFPGYEICMRPLSLSIACHIGPGALAVAVSKKI